jgi:hypothetical protein
MDQLQDYHAFRKRDPRLNWTLKHDRRSLNYLVDAVLPKELEEAPKRWTPGWTLNQRREGACVGFGWVQEMMTSPRPFTPPSVEYANQYASGYYHECLLNDEFQGEADEGTSVLAGAQTAVRRGYLGSYRWGTNVNDVRRSLISLGPVVIGIPWYSDMYFTRQSGLLDVTGDLVGGHCIVLDEFHPSKRLQYEDYDKRYRVYGFHNSWDDDYGNKGRGYFTEEQLIYLTSRWAELCIPMERKLVRF